MLITHLAAAESRCTKLERQLDVMRRLLASQVSTGFCGAAKRMQRMAVGRNVALTLAFRVKN